MWLPFSLRLVLKLIAKSLELNKKYPIFAVEIIKDHQMVVFKWVVTYTACPLGKLTRIANR